MTNLDTSMDSAEYRDQARRLNELRQRSAEQNASVGDGASGVVGGGKVGGSSASDPLVSSIPGIYAPSGFGIIDILLQVYQRPNPQITIGNVDSGVALVLCDADSPDHPIVYCSEPFEKLTGYRGAEILGHNCRFLQRPPSNLVPDREVVERNEQAKREVRSKIGCGEEVRTHFVNYRKDGKMFRNVLTLVPIKWDGRNYIVGFQADEGSLYR